MSRLFRTSHSHTIEEAYFHCQETSALGQKAWVGCEPGAKSHLLPDSPEQIYAKCLTEMLLNVCPASAVQKETTLCHRLVDPLLRFVLLSQEELLTVLVALCGSFSYLVYLYMFVYKSWHNFCDYSSALDVKRD